MFRTVSFFSGSWGGIGIWFLWEHECQGWYLKNSLVYLVFCADLEYDIFYDEKDYFSKRKAWQNVPFKYWRMVDIREGYWWQVSSLVIPYTILKVLLSYIGTKKRALVLRVIAENECSHNFDLPEKLGRSSWNFQEWLPVIGSTIAESFIKTGLDFAIGPIWRKTYPVLSGKFLMWLWNRKNQTDKKISCKSGFCFTCNMLFIVDADKDYTGLEIIFC